VPLIRVQQHTPEDLAAWRAAEREDRLLARSGALQRKCARALYDLAEFARMPCYVGTSWGKDSTVVAPLSWLLAQRGGPRLPMIWQRYEPIVTPYCDMVRDAFVAQCPGPMWLLGTRSVGYYANVANRSKYTAVAAETIMKGLVNYNATANATVANGRVREPNLIGISIAAGAAAGSARRMATASDQYNVRSCTAAIAASRSIRSFTSHLRSARR